MLHRAIIEHNLLTPGNTCYTSGVL